MDYSFLFGPVQSRRLGVSLGIDVIHSKTCSLNCVYCECGKTTELTLERREYADAAEIITELTDYLSGKPALDYITFGGSGEPTLNTGTGRILRFLKESYPQYKCALLTNGTLLHLPEVREELLAFDIVLPSLDAVSDRVFAKVNRPHRTLRNHTIIQGLIEFRKAYKGLLWLEVFIIPGTNDTPEELALFKEAIKEINPDRVQLNSLDRPGTCDWVQPASSEKLREIAAFLAPLPVEIISRKTNDAGAAPLPPAADRSRDAILAMIARRPSTVEEIATLAGLTINDAERILSALERSHRIEKQVTGNRSFYRVVSYGPRNLHPWF
jgi:wyosine [tRNA(Phe)-imidazoG37] synthetase (radical SAM superfamily)